MQTLNPPIPAAKSEYIHLHVDKNAFFLVRNKNVLEISFESMHIGKNSLENIPREARQYKIYGLLGILKGFKASYLVVITSVKQRGHIFGHPVYVIDKVECLDFDLHKACNKLDSQSTASHSDENTDTESEDTSSSDVNIFSPLKVRPDSAGPLTAPGGSIERPPVLRPSKSLLTRFGIPFRRTDIEDDREATSSAEESSSSSDQEEVALERRLIKQVTEMFSRSMFVFSYNYDITNSFQRSSDNLSEEKHDAPLLQRIDKRFWWNEHLSNDFIAQDLGEWIIPAVQGTVQIEQCEIEGYQFDFILISRRSRERAGMRYQRRGVNECGQVANFVETEQIIIFNQKGVNHVASFVQTRGSIPIFWSQSPYSLHPVPTLDRSNEENNAAFQRHFEDQIELYGRQIIVNLTELSGREAVVGSEYRKHVEHLGSPNIKYVEFDFHRQTKGMRFENISQLCESLRDDLLKSSYFWNGGDQVAYCKQDGVLRTNCMDCLDRTNVVQSAFGRAMLNLQLMRFGITENPDQGIKRYEQFERIFNNVWANNGDLISRMYAGTSALKGDFTRTGKRNITGLMNDASNSLARMYFNTVKDFWRQATIDYVLGYHKIEIFRRVPTSMQSSAEPGIERHWAKIRSAAIETSSEIVIADDEVKLDGWTLLSPADAKSKRTSKFEEKVVLLTAKALYVCSYNYNLEKVMQFKRIGLETITCIQMGEYIRSSLTPESRKISDNFGLIIHYQLNGEEVVRWNTGSLRNQNLGDLSITSNNDMEESSLGAEKDRLLCGDGEVSEVFKAVQHNMLGELLEESEESCQEQVQQIVARISSVSGHNESDEQFVQRKPIISLEEAEKTDGILKKMGHKLTKLVATRM